jgi:hypothetical protein
VPVQSADSFLVEKSLRSPGEVVEVPSDPRDVAVR